MVMEDLRTRFFDVFIPLGDELFDLGDFVRGIFFSTFGIVTEYKNRS